MARNNGKKIGLLKLITVWPVHENLIKDIARNVGRIFVVEMNMGKYAKEIERVCLPFCPVNYITKNRGIIHTKEEIYKAIKEDLS
jgi:2-oxoglutarate ferredoxin oxidoreductase subunit alpha